MKLFCHIPCPHHLTWHCSETQKGVGFFFFFFFFYISRPLKDIQGSKLLAGMDMFMTHAVISRVYTCIQSHQVVYIKYGQLFVSQSYLNKVVFLKKDQYKNNIKGINRIVCLEHELHSKFTINIVSFPHF